MPGMLLGSPPRCFALVPCAGNGSRGGEGLPKQYRPLGGRPVVGRTLSALAAVAGIEATLVVLSPDDQRFETLLPGFAGERSWLARCGGATRAETVSNGLAELLA